MKKRFLSGLFFICFVFLLTGCGAQMPDLTDEQMDAVGEYAGLLLVKYDANNRIRLLPREDVEAYDKKQAELEALRQAQEEAQ